jgi:ABC-type dipeptide/oligopeptide/nickel transport system permease subunit
MSEIALDIDGTAPRTKKPAWHRLVKDPVAMAAAAFLLLVVGAALLAPLIAPSDPYASNLRLRLCPIGSPRCPASLLGTDQTGRDMVSRMLFGLRATLMLGFTWECWPPIIAASIRRSCVSSTSCCLSRRSCSGWLLRLSSAPA